MIEAAPVSVASELPLDYFVEEFEKVCDVIKSGHSALVLGEYGSGKDKFADSLLSELGDEFRCAIALYKGSLKRLLVEIAEGLDIPTTEPRYNKMGDPIGEKALTADGLKNAIAENVNASTLLIFKEAQRLPASLRYWLEDLVDDGVLLVCFSVANPKKDVFLKLLEVELGLPSDQDIRNIMRLEAEKLGVKLDRSRFAALQPLAGRNPMLARKVIRNEALGLNEKGKPEHTQYVVMMPVIIAALLAFGIVRFVGMGTGNRGLYITGGVCLVAGMALKQLGGVRGARKRLGQ